MKIIILKWHHENVTVACLSTDEVHKAPGDPKDKLVPLKNIQKPQMKISRNLLKIARKSRQQGKIPSFGCC